MTARELRSILAECDPEAEVFVARVKKTYSNQLIVVREAIDYLDELNMTLWPVVED